ncbi:hypothetical protein BD310DRAFT_5583 [Dichomitus squalens]|uniref:Uncharacterized protein n=1 Tax=Dichomitus squalens TaxID=114155 RepID=A0A4Q9QDF4_9APHY|nr:hypothetical protein BD310DRAFT_5583 [Dichomitus squalens]
MSSRSGCTWTITGLLPAILTSPERTPSLYLKLEKLSTMSAATISFTYCLLPHAEDTQRCLRGAPQQCRRFGISLCFIRSVHCGAKYVSPCLACGLRIDGNRSSSLLLK